MPASGRNGCASGGAPSPMNVRETARGRCPPAGARHQRKSTIMDRRDEGAYNGTLAGCGEQRVVEKAARDHMSQFGGCAVLGASKNYGYF